MFWWRIIYKSRYNGGYDILETMANTVYEAIVNCFKDDYDRIISITKITHE